MNILIQKDLFLKKHIKSMGIQTNFWQIKKLSYPKNTIRLGSLFYGIGAFEQALQILGIKTKSVFACDNDEFVKKSFFANYEISEKNWFDDVQKTNGAKFRDKINLLFGGAPCQTYSKIGKRKGMEGKGRGRRVDEGSSGGNMKA